METWPLSSLPYPSTDYSGSVDAGVLRTKMDSGKARQRRKTVSELATISVKWEFSDDEMSIFRAWHAEKLNLGVDWFNIDLPFGGGLETQQARFVQGNFSPTYTAHLYWEVTASLEVIKPVRPAEGLIDLLLDTTFMSQFDDFEDAIADLNTFINITLHAQYA